MRSALDACDMAAVMRAFRTHTYHGKDISQEVAAGWVGLTQSRLSRIENGVKINDVPQLMRWAGVLGIPKDLWWFRAPRAATRLTSSETAEQPRAQSEQESRHGHMIGGLLLPVLIGNRTVLVPVDGRTMATSELGALLDELTVRGESESPAATEQVEPMNPLNRRALLKAGLATAISSVDKSELRHVALAMDDSRYMDRSVVTYLRKRLAECKSDDGTLGSGATLPVVLGILSAIESRARDARPEIRRELLSVGADGAEFAGWLYRDTRNVPQALYWHDRAMEWSQETGDLGMQGYVLIRKSQLAFDDREPSRMLTLAQAAQNGPWELPSRLRAEAVQQEARADAMLGASTDAVERKLDRARSLLLAADPINSDTALGAHYNETILTMQAAICYTEAGNPRRSVDLYADALREDVFSPRDYGFFLSWMATSLAVAGEPDHPAKTGIASAMRATNADSRRTKQELQRVLVALQPWQHRPAVKELREAMHPNDLTPSV